jgi:Histidine kinase-, DNA gyrase B-, and HSP90-like ATPase
VNVKGLIEETRSLLQASLPSRIELIVRSVPQATGICGQPEQVQQVILNLCNNAAQAIDQLGQIEIETKVCEVGTRQRLTHGRLRPGRYVRIAVVDTGRGMDEETIGRIFEPFFTTRLAGNGLGLATVREIVREHQGAINVQSEPGIGSCFEIWLPCTAAAPSMTGDDPASLPLGSGQTVLVVENASERLMASEELLAAIGYEPVGFTRADDALAACREAPNRFDTLLIGHLISTRSALDLAAALHKIAPNLPMYSQQHRPTRPVPKRWSLPASPRLCTGLLFPSRSPRHWLVACQPREFLSQNYNSNSFPDY